MAFNFTAASEAVARDLSSPRTRGRLPIAVLLASVLASTASAGDPCGDPKAGDCFTANGTPGCDLAACCSTVCTFDAFCCDVEWDDNCVAIANDNCSVPPANDLCDDAIAIGEGDVSFSTNDATSSGPDLPAECDDGFGIGFAPDVWYAVTPIEDTIVVVSTCDQADYDTRLAAYAGCDGTVVACNDDGDGCGVTSFMLFSATAGETYLIRVGGYNGAVGSGTLSVSFGAPPPPYPVEITPQWRVEDGGNGHFYASIRIPEDSTFETAEAVAAAYGAELASITSPEEAAFVSEFVPVSNPSTYDRCAFGLVQNPAGPEPAGGWFWTSGDPFDWTNWRAGEPNDNPAPENFGELYSDGEWNDCFDGDFGQVVIEWESDPGLAEGVVWPVSEGGNGHRYQAVIAYPQVDWATARQLAEEAGGRLVTLETDEERQWVADNLGVFLALWEQPQNVWEANRGPMVGLEDIGGAWQWITGEPLVGDPWYPGEPSGDGAVAQFFSLNGDGPTGLFNDYAAADGMRSYIIEFENAGGDCPADFDGDGAVSGVDLGVLLSEWGGPGEADLDGDGVVSGVDLGILLGAWGACP